MIEAVLFDLDGVIINSFESWYRAFNAMLKRYRREEISREDFKAKCWGPDLRHNLDAWNLGEEAGLYCIGKQLELVELIELFPDAKEVLSRIRHKFKIGLVTNTPKKNVARILEHFQLADLFDVVITGDDVHEGKPNAEMVIEACRRLKVKPENAILVGDTESDFQAGKSAGCTVIGIGTGTGVGAGAGADTKSCVKTDIEIDMHVETLNELLSLAPLTLNR
ncbi:MAG: HAD family hydrolase [Methanophagales archaeon]|nr:HAD family hydrolase [Methanophagales archaeon]